MKDAGGPASFLFSKRSMMERGSRRAGWFSIAMVTRISGFAAVAMAARISVAIVLARLKSGDVCLKAGSQRHRAATLERLRQVAQQIITGQFITRAGFIMSCQVTRIGQQHIDFAIAKYTSGRNGRTAGGCALECPLMQRANSLYRTTFAIGTE